MVTDCAPSLASASAISGTRSVQSQPFRLNTRTRSPIRQTICWYWRKAHYGGATLCSYAVNVAVRRVFSMLGTL